MNEHPRSWSWGQNPMGSSAAFATTSHCQKEHLPVTCNQVSSTNQPLRVVARQGPEATGAILEACLPLQGTESVPCFVTTCPTNTLLPEPKEVLDA